ncbi:MAG: hypothetical protein U0359_35585 [Byssovorax sp.]
MEHKDEPHDELLDRTRELAEARAAFDRLVAENQALRDKLGTGARAGAKHAPPRALLSSGDRPGPSGYRGEDPLVRLERELAEANGLVADLSIENAILKSQAEPPNDARPRSVLRPLAVTGVVGGIAFLYLVTANIGVVIFSVTMLVLGSGLLRLIDSIKPSSSDKRPPPYLPGG